MSNQAPAEAQASSASILVLKWAVIIGSGLAIALITPPDGIKPESWRLLAIFVATIIGSILRPMSGSAMVLLGITAVALTKSKPLSEAAIKTLSNPSDLKAIETLRLKSILSGYADPVVWLVLAAFFMSRGMIKTGLGRRIALVFIRAIGHKSLGLGYALVGTDMLLATVIPSNGARCGGITFPITKSIVEEYDSRPGETAKRLGAFLMIFIYQCEVIICAMFLTGQAGNLVIQRLAAQATNGAVDLSYTRWMLGGIVPGLVSIAVTGVLLYRLFPPEVKETPGATEFAQNQLDKMGAISFHEKLMLGVFLMVGVLWGTTNWLHKIDYSVIALLGISALLLAQVLSWSDVMAEKEAWDVFIWYGGMLRMAEALGETGLTKKFAEVSASFTTGWKWGAALAVLALIYFYAHYGFASITAHASAMYIPFLVVVTTAGAPPYLAVLVLTAFSNLSAGLTHYGTTPGPIFFGTGYVKQQTWWKYGLIASIPNILVWSTVGLLWWKLLGWW